MMRDTLTAFCFLALPAILAGCVLALPMYALRDAELDVHAGDIRFGQSEDTLGACVDDLKEAKSAKYICRKGRR